MSELVHKYELKTPIEYLPQTLAVFERQGIKKVLCKDQGEYIEVTFKLTRAEYSDHYCFLREIPNIKHTMVWKDS